MASVERERKFLVTTTHFLRGHTSERVAQTYLVTTDDVELRVRVAGTTATLTVKSAEPTVTREELEFVLESPELAVALLRSGPLHVVKDRYDVVVGDHVWNIDVFLDDNDGLVVAEVEFSEGDIVLLPEWAGAEVTGDRRYYNRHLAAEPYRSWPAL